MDKFNRTIPLLKNRTFIKKTTKESYSHKIHKKNHHTAIKIQYKHKIILF
ncbi:hypothetical protein T190115A13A_40266 [Tenacibaculum sp. 190524A02b]|uniref:Uncharacterized protein n=1 Tax=Tenacibaculum vairaonense TaxID=3137860 RepID=A0ABP1FHN3_9FLAO